MQKVFIQGKLVQQVLVTSEADDDMDIGKRILIGELDNYFT